MSRGNFKVRRQVQRGAVQAKTAAKCGCNGAQCSCKPPRSDEQPVGEVTTRFLRSLGWNQDHINQFLAGPKNTGIVPPHLRG